MTFHSIRVEHYMTKFSFLTAFFSVCVSAAKERLDAVSLHDYRQMSLLVYLSRI